VFEEKLWEVSEYASQVNDWYHHIEDGKDMLHNTANNLVRFGICIVLLALIVPILFESDYNLPDDVIFLLGLFCLGLGLYAFSKISSIPTDMKRYRRITNLIESQEIQVSKGLPPEPESREDLEDDLEE
jgi:hypothetical protein